jgi:hypothetical protein
VAGLSGVVAFLSAVLVLAKLCDDEGLFEAAGAAIARGRVGPGGLLGRVFVIAAVITAVLSLDAAVVLLTPVVLAAVRFPGGIDSPERLWEALLRGDDLVTEVPSERWDADDFYDPEPGVPGRSVGRWGAFLDDVAGFDSEFFGIGEGEAVALDPQHRLLLETSWEAVEHAGLSPGGCPGR